MTLSIALLAIGFFIGKIYTHKKVFNVLNYPLKYSGLYGIETPCSEDPNDVTIQLTLLDYYKVEDRFCGIHGVEKVDGYYELQTYAPCTKISNYNSDDINSRIYDDIKPFRFAFKPLGKGKISARIDRQPEQIYTKCHLLRDKTGT